MSLTHFEAKYPLIYAHTAILVTDLAGVRCWTSCWSNYRRGRTLEASRREHFLRERNGAASAYGFLLSIQLTRRWL